MPRQIVALVHRRGVQHFGQGVVLDAALELLLGDGVVEAVVQKCAGLAVEDVPHLGLAVLVFMLERVFVGGVHLDGQVVFGVDELGQDGEILELFAVGAKDAFALFGDVFGQRHAAFDNDGRPVRVAGQHPGFGQRVQVALYAEIGAQLVAAPQVILAGGLEF